MFTCILMNPRLLLFQLKVAAILRTQRLNAGLSLSEAAEGSGLDKGQLLKYELGLTSPAMNKLYRLLNLYHADENAILFFCCLPFGRANVYGAAVSSP
jgi:transcriptional regulator with XRE-family HTH domain